MRTEEMILEEYRKGGLYERLNLYLQYRDLRCRFTQIDSDERASPQAVVSESKAGKNTDRNWFHRAQNRQVLPLRR